jgi:hypothetical protein
MLQIQGALQILPATISTEPGEIRAEDGTTQSAIVLTLGTLSGPVQIIVPTSSVEAIIKGITEANKQAAEVSKTNSSDLYVPGSAMEVEQIKKAHDQLNKRED